MDDKVWLQSTKWRFSFVYLWFVSVRHGVLLMQKGACVIAGRYKMVCMDQEVFVPNVDVPHTFTNVFLLYSVDARYIIQKYTLASKYIYVKNFSNYVLSHTSVYRAEHTHSVLHPQYRRRNCKIGWIRCHPIRHYSTHSLTMTPIEYQLAHNPKLDNISPQFPINQYHNIKFQSVSEQRCSVRYRRHHQTTLGPKIGFMPYRLHNLLGYLFQQG